MPSSSLDDDLRVEMGEEQGRLWRALRFIIIVMIFYIGMLYLDYEHQTILMMIGIGGFLLWIVYMIFVIIVLKCPTEKADDDVEEQCLTRNDEETSTLTSIPQKIRSCQDEINTGESPQDGIYEIVYNATFFRRSFRTQATLHLTFQRNKCNSGWSISGHSESSAGSRPISEGFVNAKGQMYWTIHEKRNIICIYRGVFDLSSNSMFGGDFHSSTNKGANGSIVRLALVNPFGSSNKKSMEMVSLQADISQII
jgi:hypothetical protein